MATIELDVHIKHIQWRALSWSGLEQTEIRVAEDGRTSADGVVIGEIDGTAVRLRYTLEFDETFTVASARVEELQPGGTVIQLRRTEGGRWLDESNNRLPLLDGLDEIDIQATPLTNTPTLRRLRLEPGESREVEVAYVAVVPSLRLERLRQRYTRVATFDAARAAYVFESVDSDFRAVITVDAEEYVLDYEGLWTRA